ncbi:Matrix extracellular phosphoglycoprotein [Fukomys damarensis]|uniref:Matrix extracellular phosphoglycoprotein n=1 Tax=Fukomys damarensis TaxID=885580 RepID=A0A091CVE0_FUKDA|nr:Matrix extracellular phosphoglycoprotein [Fukomys damarensis]
MPYELLASAKWASADWTLETRINFKFQQNAKTLLILQEKPGFSEGQRSQQEEKSKDNITLHRFDKRRNQELPSYENIVLESEKVLFLLEANVNNQSNKSTYLSENRQTLKEEHRVIHNGKAHKDGMELTYPQSTGSRGAKDGDNGTRSLDNQEEYSAALIRNKAHHVMTVTEEGKEENQETNPRNSQRKIPVDVNHAKAHSKGKKSHQPGVRAQSSPVTNKTTQHNRRSTHYLPQLSKVRRVPSDFEGSGYTDLQGRGDNDISPFSGDGQPFKDISGREEAVGPNLESVDRQTGLSGLGEAETVNTDIRGLGPNEIPEGKEHGGDAHASRAGTSKGAGEAAVSLVEGSSDITGSTNFRDLPGKEGNRVDAGSQNAHRGKIELHYPRAPSKEQIKGDSGITTHNEIPKHGRGGTRKATELSGRNQGASSEKHQSSSKGESQGFIIPSHGLDNEIKNEIGSHRGPHNEGNVITHSGKNSYAPRGQNDWVRSEGGSQRRGPWGYRRHPSSRGFSSRKRGSSSESSGSSSSSESGGH